MEAYLLADATPVLAALHMNADVRLQRDVTYWRETALDAAYQELSAVGLRRPQVVDDYEPGLFAVDDFGLSKEAKAVRHITRGALARREQEVYTVAVAAFEDALDEGVVSTLTQKTVR